MYSPYAPYELFFSPFLLLYLDFTPFLLSPFAAHNRATPPPPPGSISIVGNWLGIDPIGRVRDGSGSRPSSLAAGQGVISGKLSFFIFFFFFFG